MNVHGAPGMMPTEADFNYVGQRTLDVAVAKFGYSHVATRLGLKESAQGQQRALDTLLSSTLINAGECDEDETNGDGNWDEDDPLSMSALSLDDLNLGELQSLIDKQEDEVHRHGLW
jgi:hypothetical protein